MKETLKINKGITLIALVITIIVLIILAGISISILMGENGLITKAKQGALNYQNAAVEEQEMLNNLHGDFASEIAKTGGGDAAASLISFKRTIAEAITNAGVATSENDSVETMASNIAEIYQGRYDAGVAAGENTSINCEKIFNAKKSGTDQPNESVTLNKDYKMVFVVYSCATWQNGTYTSSFSHTVSDSPTPINSHKELGNFSDNNTGHGIYVYENLPKDTVISLSFRASSVSIWGLN